MTEQLFLLTEQAPPEGALYAAEDTLVQRTAGGGTRRVTGRRFLVTWKILGALIKESGRPVRLVHLNSGIHAYTQVS